MDDSPARRAKGRATDTDYRAIARRCPGCFPAGDGDSRVLMRNDPAEIRAMVERMVQTANMSRGYVM